MTNAEFDDLRDRLRAEHQAAAGDAARQAKIKAVFDELTPIQNAQILADLAERAKRLTALSTSLRASIQQIEHQIDNFLLTKLNSLQAEVDAGAAGGSSPPAGGGGTAGGGPVGGGVGGGGSPPVGPAPGGGLAPGGMPPGAGASSIAVDLAALTAPHQRFANSITWHLMPTGLSISGAAPEDTGGQPQTVKRVWDDFGSAIEQSAQEFGVPAELIIATICTESSGNPKAIRFEPGYVSDEETPGQVSPGLMQTLISTARDTLPGVAIDRDWLFVPGNSIRAGTAYIRKQSGSTKLDPPVVACAYNAGSVKENTGAGNRWKMRQFPIGKSEHADRFVKWFNDCFRFFAANGISPPLSFHELLNS